MVEYLVELSLGVTPANGTVATADDAARRAVSLAEEAARSETFGIGGLLIDRRGRVIAQAVNAVIRDGIVRDPTAHVERQLIDWYFAHTATEPLPAPSELIIVSSLDPCAMCAGAILKSGFAAVAVAEDPLSGVHEGGYPRRMPSAIWTEADSHLALFATRGRRDRSEACIGGTLEGEIAQETLSRANAAFEGSLARVRAAIGGDSDNGSRGPSTASSSMLERARDFALPSGTFFASSEIASVLELSSDELRELLAGARSVLIDQSGRPLIVAESAEDRSPARSSVLELIRAYTALRQHAGSIGVSLPHPRHCSALKWEAPDSGERALLEFGALGSFLEEHRYPGRFPLLTYLRDEHGQAQDFAASLPPLYTEIIGVDTGPLPADDRTILSSPS
jgi:cytosine deaminase